MWIGWYTQPSFVRLILSAALCLHRCQLHRLRPQFVALWISVIGLQGLTPVWAGCEAKENQPDRVLSITYRPIVRSDLQHNFKDLSVTHHRPGIIKIKPECTVLFSHLPPLSGESGQREKTDSIFVTEQRVLVPLFRHFLLPESLYDDRDLATRAWIGYGRQVIESETQAIEQVTYPLYPVRPSWNKPATIDLVIDVSGSSAFYFRSRNNGEKKIEAIKLLYKRINKWLLENDELQLHFLGRNLVTIRTGNELDENKLMEAIEQADPNYTSMHRLFEGLPGMGSERHQVTILVTDGEPDEPDVLPLPNLPGAGSRGVAQAGEKKEDWIPKIGEWLDERADRVSSTSHLFLVVIRHYGNKGEANDKPEERAKRLRERLLPAHRPVEILSVPYREDLYAEDTLNKITDFIARRIGRGPRIVISKEWGDDDLDYLLLKMESTTDIPQSLPRLQLDFHPVVSSGEVALKSSYPTPQSSETLIPARGGDRGKIVSISPILLPLDKEKLLNLKQPGLFAIYIRGENLSLSDLTQLPTRRGFLDKDHKVLVFDVPGYYANDRVDLTVHRQPSRGLVAAHSLWAATLSPLLAWHPLLGNESMHVELRHTGSLWYSVGAEIRKFYPRTGQIALNPPNHLGTGITYINKPNCDDFSGIQEISKSCTDIIVNPPFPLRLDTDLPVYLYYDFNPDGRQPVLAEMLKSDAQRKAYSAEGSSIRLLVDNRYYEDTRINRWLWRILGDFLKRYYLHLARSIRLSLIS